MGWVVVVAGWVGVQFCCQILLGCCETKLLICHKGRGHHLWVGVVGGVGKFGCQIYVGCSKTKLLICHKGGVHHVWVVRWIE